MDQIINLICSHLLLPQNTGSLCLASFRVGNLLRLPLAFQLNIETPYKDNTAGLISAVQPDQS